MKRLRPVLLTLTTLLVWLGLMRGIGSIRFTPAMTDLLVRTTSALGIYGVEDVEDAFLICATIVILVVAMLIVRVASKLLRRSAQMDQPAS